MSSVVGDTPISRRQGGCVHLPSCRARRICAPRRCSDSVAGADHQNALQQRQLVGSASLRIQGACSGGRGWCAHRATHCTPRFKWQDRALIRAVRSASMVYLCVVAAVAGVPLCCEIRVTWLLRNEFRTVDGLHSATVRAHVQLYEYCTRTGTRRNSYS